MGERPGQVVVNSVGESVVPFGIDDGAEDSVSRIRERRKFVMDEMLKG